MPLIGGDDGAVGQRDGLRRIKAVELRIARRVLFDKDTIGHVVRVGDVVDPVVENFRIAIGKSHDIVLAALVVDQGEDRGGEQKELTIGVVHLVDRDQIEIVAVHSEVGCERGRALQMIGEFDVRQEIVVEETVIVDEQGMSILAADLVPIRREDLGHNVVLQCIVREIEWCIGPAGATRPAGSKAAVAERRQRDIVLAAGQRRGQHEFGAVPGDAIRVQNLPAHIDRGAVGVGPGYDDVAIEELCYRRSILVSGNSRVDGVLGPELRKTHGALLVIFVLPCVSCGL